MLGLWKKSSTFIPISELPQRLGATVSVIGRISARSTLSPISRHPCAAWWCWIASSDGEGWRERGAAFHGYFLVEDNQGSIPISAGACHPDGFSSSTLIIDAADWPASGASAEHDRVRELCDACGIDEPATCPTLRFQETFLPLGALVKITGLVVGVGGDEMAPYRGMTGALATDVTLGRPPGGWIEVTPR